MILFFVGIVELAIATYWTRSVTATNVRSAGFVTGINFIIWYFVIRQVVENIDRWQAIVPYGLGCVAGSMIGTAIDVDAVIRRIKRRKASQAHEL